MMSLDNTIWLAGIVTEAAVVGLLVYRRVWRLLPLFCIYCIWDLLINIAGLSAHLLHSSTNTPVYLTLYLVETIVDSLLQFGVLVELAWSVLRPIRASLPRFALVVVGVAIFGVGAAVWPFIVVLTPHGAPPIWNVLLHLQQTVSILRVLFFLLLAGSSQFLSIGWRDRELQLATGLGIYSLVSVAVTMLQSHQTAMDQYVLLNRIAIAGFLCSLLYWAFSFAQKEAERRAFTPQMQNMLLAVAGVARADRTVLAEATSASRSHRRP